LESLISFVQNWGYIAVFLGSLVEGESVILTASAMAKLGYLSIYKVAIIAFTGTLIADQGLYFVGWVYGPSLFDRFPKLRPSFDRATRLLHRHDAAFIIACRFIYGIRITSPIVIGAAGVSPARFVPLNILSAAIWASISCAGGYIVGDIMIDLFHAFFNAQKYFFLGVALLIACIITFFAMRKWRKK
jgi:membrane protein DedA with SNARE-associated domain